jgi:type III pantothenate kinase
MIVVVDIGNSAIKAGIFDGGELRGNWRVPSSKVGVDELRGRLAGVGPLQGACFCSVVPALSGEVAGVLRTFYGEVVEVTQHTRMPMRSEYDGPVGVDRLVNAVAAVETRAPAIVVSVGTAITVDAVSADRVFRGGAIWSGLELSARALADHTAALPRVDVRRVVDAVGTNTETAIRSGVLFGAAGGVDRLIAEMRRVVGEGARVVATGGAAELLVGVSREVVAVDRALTLKGLRIVYEFGAGRV